MSYIFNHISTGNDDYKGTFVLYGAIPSIAGMYIVSLTYPGKKYNEVMLEEYRSATSANVTRNFRSDIQTSNLQYDK
jgi:hypothetical protein